MWPDTNPVLNFKLFSKTTCTIRMLLKKLFDTWTCGSYLIVIQNRVREKYKKFKTLNINDAGYTTWKLAWEGGWRIRSCQEIEYFWRTLSSVNIIVTRWSFDARNAILSLAFLLFLWDNALQKLRIPLHFTKCELLICTLE